MRELTKLDILQRCGNLPPPYSLRADDSVEFKERTADQEAIHELIVDTLMGDYESKARIAGRKFETGDKIEWDKLAEKHLPNSYVGQNTGSCVGANWFNMLVCQIVLESIIKKTGEQPDARYWWLYTYGWGRYFGGMTDEGDGSYLSVQFKAAMEKGIVHSKDFPDHPQFKQENGALWLSAQTEYEWAAQKNIPPELDAVADDHLVIDGAMIDRRNAVDTIREAIWSGPVSIASMFGTKRVEEREGIPYARYNDRWAHKMFIGGWWKHPSLGELAKIINVSWLPSKFSKFWTPVEDLARVSQERGTEFSVTRDFNGMAAAGIDLEWLINLIMSL